MGAALEALNQAGFPGGAGVGRLGILQCMFNGCVQFSGKFYREVLETPTLASPLIFPETVYNAPASHVAAFLGADGPVTTLVGEGNIIMEALAMARTWLEEDLVDHCLVIGAEECDWLGAEAATYYHRHLRASEGAGALLVSLGGEGLRLHATAPKHYHERAGQAIALHELASTFPHVTTLIDQVAGIAPLDASETAAWHGINGAERLHPRKVLGESMGGSAALQLALAASLVRQRGQPVHVSLPGGIGAAYGAVVSP
jgi:hypothetical protein